MTHYSNSASFTLSQEQLSALGLDIVAYVRPFQRDGKKAFALYSADGRKISVSLSHHALLRMAEKKDLIPLPLN